MRRSHRIADGDFRLAISDYLGLSYSHEGVAPLRTVRCSRYKSDALVFLSGPWAKYFSDLLGLEASAILRQAKFLEAEMAVEAMVASAA